MQRSRIAVEAARIRVTEAPAADVRRRKSWLVVEAWTVVDREAA
ncbi:hypothetical protein VSH64_37985 [Amycolatopsis rhabdoformis]|uniref:Uncharacterized protein n=1 Tax=Amycolatopsis rhabdoformis TaxID=1448059 RepID=A0ABZ1I2H3_9PSEU|nr:hypothetical protein [Amycolatopsis rhabdoformis]WSE28576.1 hypothetical protein VSH64_37985 [Amycolatopsis rhabdoformis]